MSKKKIENPVVLENLYNRRKERKLTQEQIAALVGISRDTYSDYELGKKPIPSNVLKELSRILGVSCDYLLDMPNASLNIGNKEIENMTGLNEQAIERLRSFNMISKPSVWEEVCKSTDCYTLITPTDMLNMIINSSACPSLLQSLGVYISPENKKPKYYFNDYYLSCYKPSDFTAMTFDNNFIESMAMLQIQKHIDTIKSDYINQNIDTFISDFINQTKNGSDN